MCIQIVGSPSKTSAFVDLMSKLGVLEATRTGIVAVERGSRFYKDEEDEDS
jgi:acetolactate synthase small subunit